MLPAPAGAMTVVEPAAAYKAWAKEVFERDGKTARSAERVALAMRAMAEAHGPVPMAEFGPLALQAIQAHAPASAGA